MNNNLMKIERTSLEGVYVLSCKVVEDNRGTFVKIIQKDFLAREGLSFDMAENYYSISNSGVIRGMHFQVPPMAHDKIIYVSYGEIMDVVLDIRTGSPTYGKYLCVKLSDENRKALYISEGFAHGFLSMKNHSIVTYLQTTEYSPEHDCGIKWDSFGMCWDIETPIVSERDSNFLPFQQFKSPFF